MAAAQVVAETFRRLGTDTVDLLQVHNMHGTAELMPTLRALKQERRIRYIGATTSRDEQYPELLAAAAGKGVAVLVNMPFGGRRDGKLLRKLGERHAAGRRAALTHGDVMGLARGVMPRGGRRPRGRAAVSENFTTAAQHQD